MVASSEEEAKTIHPDGKHRIPSDSPSAYGWTNDPKDVKVTRIGYCDRDYTSPQVILSSYQGG